MGKLQLILSLAGIIKKAVELGPDVIKTISDAKPFAEQIVKSTFGKTEITKEELAALEASIDDLANQLQVPLPPE